MAVRFRCPRQDCQSDRCPAKKVFGCLTARQDEKLGRERLARRYETGQVVIHHDTPALAVLSIHSGMVKLTRSCSNGSKATVGLRGPGQLLGVREVLSAMPYQASVETLEPAIICAIPRESFLSVVRDCPELAIQLLSQIARDFLLTEEQLVARTCLSVRERTARLLVTLMDGQGNGAPAPGVSEVSMAREEMALLVGTTRETLSRTLSELEERGAIRFAKKTICVTNPVLLERLSE